MSRHNHSHCLHDLKYCEHCDVVYCTLCDREWGGHVHYQPYTWYWGGTPYTVRWEGGSYTLTAANTGIPADASVMSVFSSQPHTKEIGDIDTINCGTVCTHHN